MSTPAYSPELRAIAIKEYYAGASGRMVGKIHGFSKANVYNWIKDAKKISSVWISPKTNFDNFELTRYITSFPSVKGLKTALLRT